MSDVVVVVVVVIVVVQLVSFSFLFSQTIFVVGSVNRIRVGEGRGRTTSQKSTVTTL